METRIVNGKLFVKAMNAGLAYLKANVEEVNELNVFPIPDGDTGNNMCATLVGGVNAIDGITDESLGEIADKFARGALLGARGNSGVILSQMIAGIADGLNGLETATVYDVAKAFKQGVKRAYAAVAKPVEGTMLTVLRDATEHATESMSEETTLEYFTEHYIEETIASVARTPELLPVLADAGVVDSGGVGVRYIAEGIYKALCGEEVEFSEQIKPTAELDFSKFNENSVMEFGYCTEFLLQLQRSKTDVENFSVEELISFLETVGDSIVAFITGTVVKVHVHTFTPGKVLEHCQKFGEFLTLKIENMTLQHNETVDKKKEKKFKKNPKRKQFGIVTVVNGDGVKNLMTEFGADVVIDGGQSNNPSVEDFVEAYEAVNADVIFVLPNNGNIIMAAKHSAELFKDSEIIVVPTKSIGEGYSALSMMDFESGDKDVILEGINEGIDGSVTGMVSKSIRNANLNEVNVKKDDYIGFVEKKMLVSTPYKVDAAMELLEKLGAGEREFIITFYGKDSTEKDRAEFAERVKEKYKKAEFYEIDGGQEVYDFMIVLQ